MVVDRTVTWGEGLVVEQFKYPGGLKAAVEAIRAEVGPHIGTRNTFGKLLRVTDPEDLADSDKYRAWLLLAAFGQSPSTWGIPDSVVPRSVDAGALRKELGQARHAAESGTNPGTTSANAATTRRYPDRKPDRSLRITARSTTFGVRAA